MLFHVSQVIRQARQPLINVLRHCTCNTEKEASIFLYVLAGPVNTPLLEGEKIKGIIEPNQAVEKILEASKTRKQGLQFPTFWKYFSWLMKNMPQKIKEKIIYG